MKLLVDGVAFQPTPEATIAETRLLFWSTLIEALATFDGPRVVLLDRGGAPVIDAVEAIPFPSLGERYRAADSELLQQMADHVGADIFLSTGVTTPLRLPSLLLVYPREATDGGEAELASVFARQTLAIDGSALLNPAIVAADIHERLKAIVARHASGIDDTFFDEWSELRLFQIAVDV